MEIREILTFNICISNGDGVGFLETFIGIPMSDFVYYERLIMIIHYISFLMEPYFGGTNIRTVNIIGHLER